MIRDRERIVIPDGCSIDLFKVNAYMQLSIFLWDYHYGTHPLSMLNFIYELCFKQFIDLLFDFPCEVIIVGVRPLLARFGSVFHGYGMLADSWVNSL